MSTWDKRTYKQQKPQLTTKKKVKEIKYGSLNLDNSVHGLENRNYNPKFKVQFNRVKTHKHIECLFSNYQCGTSFSQHNYEPFFSPNKNLLLRNYIGLEKEWIWPIYNTVNSPLFQVLWEATCYMLLSALWSFHCPLSPPQGKRGETQINPFNYLLVVLVKG